MATRGLVRGAWDQRLRRGLRAGGWAAGADLFINARLDLYLRGRGEVAEAVARAGAYLAAGADGIFVPGVVDPDTVAALVAGIAAPVNVLAGPGAPSVGELAKLGVARVSLGATVATAAYAVMARAAEEALTAGTYAAVADGLDYGTLNELMRSGPYAPGTGSSVAGGTSLGS